MDEDHYRVLGVSADADPAVIRAAYLALIRKHHPDSALDAQARQAAEQKTKALNAAYTALSDADRRRAYDARRVRPRPSLSKTEVKPRARFRAAGPRGSKGPSLEARRSRLRKVRWLSVGLAIGALALIFVGATGVVGLIRPAWKGWSPSSASALAPPNNPSPAEDGYDNVMLPWPPSGAGARRFEFEDLSVSFDAAQGPRLTVSTPRGARMSLSGEEPVSDRDVNLFGVGRLEGDRGANVVLIATQDGSACCLRLRAVYQAGRTLKVAELGEMARESAERFPSDLDRDGVREWVTPDNRFAAAFGPSALPPPRVLQFRQGAFVDVSKGESFRKLFADQLAECQRLCTLGSSGACASFVANASRLGRTSWAWDIMERNYARDPIHQASDTCAEEGCPADSPERFPNRLRAFLIQAGYVEARATAPSK